MKKFVIILLTILPIFLIVVISFAGRIIAELNPVPVESVSFVDALENKYDENHIIKINKGDTYQTKIKIYPELATNKLVTYTSSDLDVCTIDENGLVTAIGNKIATAIIIVKTFDSDKVARLLIYVTDEKVSSVAIEDSSSNSVEELELNVGDSVQLTASIEPYTAINKKVIWTSSDSSVVSVGHYDGVLTAKKQGTVTITVTTVDGGFTDTCVVTVGDGKAKLAFDFSDNDNIYPKNDVYITKQNKIRLIDFISYDESIMSLEDIVITLDSGPAELDETTGILTINAIGPVTITASVNDGSGIKITITLFLES